MLNSLLIIIGKTLRFISQTFNLGHGSTWPGHIALKINKNFIADVLKKSNTKIILIAGTNGKTTTSLMLKTILEKNSKSILHNASGANLKNGIASYLLLHAQPNGRIAYDYAIFESDENTLPQLLSDMTPAYVIILNLFRDQLDRYGEVTVIAQKWRAAFEKLTTKTTLVLNADDPLVATLGQRSKAQHVFFGINTEVDQKMTDFAVDSLQCQNCGKKLLYKRTFFSHLGIWSCPNCLLTRPKPEIEANSFYPLDGTYNKYNTHAAILTARLIGIDNTKITQALKEFSPAFGRQEIINFNGKKVQIFLSKNPTGFNESLKTIRDKKAKHVMLLLNDRIPDGRDVSWIWDVDFENTIDTFSYITVSGDRVYDMALRLKYAHQTKPSSHPNITPVPVLSDALEQSIQPLSDETLYILATYSAMLEIRKLLTGKKIL